MTHVKIYTTNYCGYCKKAKALLEERGIAFEEIDVTDNDSMRDWLVKKTGFKTVPQIFIDEEPIGGYDQLAELDQTGSLKK
ncbi:MAG: glutaredoxin 3 [Deltaproteobacteria bacterium RIFCSPLOWO2_01_44_7]|nr:MAG: glutaredoxin 3 [Deltaproteobacteria bacterium RIFCSPHIGHO2_01_FULL_43_49]OGQ14198.1 MAG: glutaredoxin 3 [Deltaproteobacteria bacterium RIFCSPHIGHO2_02_FULL_44_53]OGQ27414.1 MAG: glutaredoxin 3 [Deltaproteobacteria bacterium RIFCSPHIGHO2_12_FULL_44_21]OGQ30662.1 MAG: glutaredoxin 3 [Deltaproteobacteria bacterium RIFCSPLOWO2_01_FULL_45_74]OGQ39458.1 MAG: glutaredoxin 3 [Deltaproteobacteria bacterium RIFCSPLOWO2_01_44_7]OGQ42340.1 MAG: glutaredoxin 3 [Deltaproteobacteria bacterium RIFCSPL